jgi:hypothetical protein
MQDTDLPPFPTIAGCLFAIILSTLALLSAGGCVIRDGPDQIPPLAAIALAGLVLVIFAAVLWLVRMLFPAWLRVGHSAAVLQEVMEIEGRV